MSGDDEAGGVAMGEEGAGLVGGERPSCREHAVDVGDAVVGVFGEEGGTVVLQQGFEPRLDRADGRGEGGVAFEESQR